ncbi:MAG: maleate cis-trans isomerase [Rhodospirillaceae bacterium]|jgi:maleate isomerase|nr:maleate cis-trans isomerase [Rhodospirillaceae bacterium]MBT5458447.1 maleate cis-trans isomerase [Rhodospirillaceae bacterium]
MYGWRARLGRINPSPETVGDEEWRRLCPDGTTVVSTRMFIEAVDSDGLTAMVGNVERAAKELATARPDVILMAGTAGAFNGGPGFDRELSRRIEDASGVPGTTTMTAVLEALDALDIQRIAVATSYIASVDESLAAVLRASGRDVVLIRGMDILKSIDMGDISPEAVYRFARETVAAAEGADGCLLSCGNWRTLESVTPLEAEFGIPVITSNQAGIWQSLRMADVSTQDVSGGGRLFSLPGKRKQGKIS